MGRTDGDPHGGWDFFVSYTQADRAWAEWVAWVLEEDGYRVLVQAWDFVPGSNWVEGMQAGTRDATRTIAVLSPDYLASVYGRAEWQAAVAGDPGGVGRRLLIVRVSACERPGLLAAIVGVDLFGVGEAAARNRLRKMVLAAAVGRAKPAVAPRFPGADRAVPQEPGFPGGSGQAADTAAGWRQSVTAQPVSVIEVAIGPGTAAGRFRVQVVNSPAGEASAEVGLDVAALGARRAELQQAVLASAVATRGVLREERCVREVGQGLFAALLGTGEVAGRYRASAAVAAERGQELRVVLRIDDPLLAGLPWEAMYDQAAGGYVCRRDQLVRHVAVASAPQPLAVGGRLRILGIVSSPRGLPRLDTGKEKEQLTRALAGPVSSGLVELAWAPSATWADLQDVLLGGRWHVVHFIGHGDFDPARDEGVLALMREDDRADLVEASRLVDLLRQARPVPRLVVLNSCAGAATGVTDLFSGTAAALVRGEVSAVAAMQYEISDPAAVAFSRGFYGAIAQGRGVDEAVSSGRVAIVGLSGRTLEWVTPVLYLRGHDSRLFTTPTAAPPQSQQQPAQAPADEEPGRPGPADPQPAPGPDESASVRARYAALLTERKRILGPDHRDTLEIREKLASITEQEGNLGAARDLYRVLAADRERVLGPDHPDTLRTRDNLALMTHRAADTAAARDLYRVLAADRERVLGPDHPDTLRTRDNLAHMTGQAGDDAAARDLYRVLAADYERVLGPDHPDTLESRRGLASWTGYAGDAVAARDLYRVLAADRERVLGPDHPDTLYTRDSLAFWTGQAGNAVAARDLYRAVVADRERVLGSDHPDTLRSRDGLASWTGYSRDAVAARNLYRALAADYERVLGPDHSDTLYIRDSLAFWVNSASAHGPMPTKPG